MAICEVCGNDYDKAFEVRRGEESHVFDSFECAIHALAPTCAHCGCRVIGHGTEADGYTVDSDGGGLVRVTNTPDIDEFGGDWGTHPVTP